MSAFKARAVQELKKLLKAVHMLIWVSVLGAAAGYGATLGVALALTLFM